MRIGDRSDPLRARGLTKAGGREQGASRELQHSFVSVPGPASGVRFEDVSDLTGSPVEPRTGQLCSSEAFDPSRCYYGCRHSLKGGFG